MTVALCGLSLAILGAFGWWSASRWRERYRKLVLKVLFCNIAWDNYTSYLRGKYPAKEGEEWEFTCEYHRDIDAFFHSAVEEVVK